MLLIVTIGVVCVLVAVVFWINFQERRNVFVLHQNSGGDTALGSDSALGKDPILSTAIPSRPQKQQAKSEQPAPNSQPRKRITDKDIDLGHLQFKLTPPENIATQVGTAKRRKTRKATSSDQIPSHNVNSPGEYQFIILTLLVPEEEDWVPGSVISELLGQTAMRYYEEARCYLHIQNNREIFRLFNGIEPALFNLEDFECAQTHSLGLGMRLPTPPACSAVEGFEHMRTIAELFNKQLGFMICDNNRTPMPASGLDKLRSRIKSKYSD